MEWNGTGHSRTKREVVGVVETPSRQTKKPTKEFANDLRATSLTLL
jgi:hypothetical protein